MCFVKATPVPLVTRSVTVPVIWEFVLFVNLSELEVAMRCLVRPLLSTRWCMPRYYCIPALKTDFLLLTAGLTGPASFVVCEEFERMPMLLLFSLIMSLSTPIFLRCAVVLLFIRFVTGGSLEFFFRSASIRLVLWV